MTIPDLQAFAMERVASVDALSKLLAERTAAGQPTVLLAGGTDWMVEQEMRRPVAPDATLPLVVDISRLHDLRGIDLDGDHLRIGAAATYLEMRHHPAVRERAPLLERMARDVGAEQIQARGTLGGNLATASPAADGVAALAAYDATIVVRSVRGERRIPFADLQTGYKQGTRAADEVIIATEITLPPVAAGSRWIWRKVGTRRAQAISKMALAGVAVVEDGRCTRFGLGMASVGPTTALLPTVRALALSMPLDGLDGAALDAAVESDIRPIDDVRSTGDYRLHVAKAAVRGFVRELQR